MILSLVKPWGWFWYSNVVQYKPEVGQHRPFLVKIDRILCFFFFCSISTDYNNLYYNFEYFFSQFLAIKITFFSSKSINFYTWVIQNGHSSGSESFYVPFSQFFLSDLGWFREPDLGDTNVAHLYNIRSSLSRRLTARGARESRMSLIHQ